MPKNSALKPSTAKQTLIPTRKQVTKTATKTHEIMNAAKATINNNLRELGQLLLQSHKTNNKNYNGSDNKENEGGPGAGGSTFINLSKTEQEKIQKIYSVTIEALKVLQGLESKQMEKGNNDKNFDTEKAYLNLTTKMIELELYDNALETAQILHTRLWKYHGKSNNSTAPKKSGRKSLQQINVNENESSSSELLTLYRELLRFPLDSNIDDPELIIVLLANQLNVLRCLVASKDTKLILCLPVIFKARNSIFDWCERLRHLNVELAAKQYSMLGRIIHRACHQMQSISGDNSLRSLQLRVFSMQAFIHTNLFVLDLFFEQAVRSGKHFEKACQSQSIILYQHLSKAYEEIYELVRATYHEKFSQCPRFFVWLDHYAYAAKKANGYKAAISVYRLASRPMDIIKYASFKINILYHAFESLLCDEEIDVYNYLEEAKEILFELTKSIPSKSLNQEDFNNFSNLFKTFEIFRGSCIKILDFLYINENQVTVNDNASQTNEKIHSKNKKQHVFINKVDENHLYASIYNINHLATELLSFFCESHFNQYKEYFKAAPNLLLHPDKLSLITIRTIELFIRTKLDVSRLNDDDTYSTYITYIEKAIRITRITSDSEGLHFISNMYYLIGGFYYKQNQFRIALESFQNACVTLKEYLDFLRNNHSSIDNNMKSEIESKLSKRYEVLGSCHDWLCEYQNATKDFENSLKFIPKSEYLRFSKLSATKSVFLVSQEHTIIPQLIDRYVKSTYLNCPNISFTPTHEIMLSVVEDGIEIAGLVEYELHLMKRYYQKIDLTRTQMLLCDKLLEWYSQDEYPIRRARVLLEKSKLLRRCEDSSQIQNELIILTQAIELLKSEEHSRDEGLLELRQFYLASAYAWLSIVSQESDNRFPEGFKIALTLWKGILAVIVPYGNGIPTTKSSVDQIKMIIDDAEAFYYELQMLADFFGMSNQPINHILTIKLLLRLNNGIRDSSREPYPDCVSLYNQMGHIYLTFGYTGKAGLAFSQAKAIMDSIGCTEEVKLTWMLGYSQYLCSVGNIKKSLQYFNNTRVLANSRLPRQKSLSRANLAKQRHQAIIDSKRSLHLLKRSITNINRDGGCVKQERTTEENPFLQDTSTNGSLSDQSKELCRLISLTAQRWQWHISKRLVDCYEHLGRLYIIRGSVKEADFFLQQGLKLTKLSNAFTAMSRPLLSLAELSSRKHCWGECEEKLEQVLVYQNDGDAIQKDKAIAKLCYGDLRFRRQEYDTALQFYSTAENIITDIMKEEYISHLENIELSAIQTPRAKKLISIPPMTPRVKVLEQEIQFECFLLNHIKADLFRRTGHALSKKRNIEQALDMIENSKVINQSPLEKAEHYLVLGKIKIQYILFLLSRPTFSALKIICDSVLSLPRNRITSVRQNTEYPDNITLQIQQATEYLTKAYDHAFESGTTQTLSESAFGLVRANMIEVYSQNLSSAEQAKMTRECAFYLEMAKGIAAKREMISVLSERLMPEYTFDDMKWPLTISSNKTTISNIKEHVDDKVSNNDDDEDNMINFTKTLYELYKKETYMTSDQFQSEFVDILPPNWTVCTISIDVESEDMYICRLRRSRPPFILRLPLKRQSSQEDCYEDDDGFSYEAALAEFNGIIESSNKTLQVSKTFQTQNEKVEWWKSREQLDNRLKELLINIENCWLGGFKGILMTNDQEDDLEHAKKFKCKLEDIVNKNLKNMLTKKNVKEQLPLLNIDLELCQTLLRLGEDASYEDISDFLYFLLDAYNYNEIRIAYDEVDIDQLSIDLKVTIEQFGFDASNTSYNKNNANNVAAKDHIILILDKSVQMFPWENLPCLRSQAVSRLPSLSFLRDRILMTRNRNQFRNKMIAKSQVWTDYTIDYRNAFYVLNPSRDFPNTQRQFQEFFERFETWDGVTGRALMDYECKNGLKNHDLYLYFDHGGGEQYIRSYQVRQLDHCAVTLLMGCSSGHLKPVGEFDPSGVALSYIMAGCPALVANLWDVTDGDLDRLSKSLFNNWFIHPSQKVTRGQDNKPVSSTTAQIKQSVSLVQAVSLARENCRLKYLNGAATVVYGIPCYLLTSDM
ncbi:1932_t:CDS:10 [Ambispora gerdemannii]|uniref:separase n=1 Tax=Ambispora gerdemannii TaxID=144530 RepID=A0A9N8ZM45_9GLOM|nr:1932_t:CDS:10 [Ambispora gerdemannii]